MINESPPFKGLNSNTVIPIKGRWFNQGSGLMLHLV